MKEAGWYEKKDNKKKSAAAYVRISALLQRAKPEYAGCEKMMPGCCAVLHF